MSERLGTWEIQSKLFLHPAQHLSLLSVNDAPYSPVLWRMQTLLPSLKPTPPAQRAPQAGVASELHAGLQETSQPALPLQDTCQTLLKSLPH